ncbi:hypothetical protein ACFL4G_04785 [Thermodesulfobacteriota bacterium]
MIKYSELILGLSLVSAVLAAFAFYFPYDIDELNYLQLAWHVENEGWQLGRDFLFSQLTCTLSFFLSSVIAVLGDGGLLRYRFLFLGFSILAILCFRRLFKQACGCSSSWGFLLFPLLLLSTKGLLFKAFEVRSDPLQIALFGFYISFFAAWLRNPSPLWPLTAGVTAAILLWLKITIVPYIVVPFVLVLAYSEKRGPFFLTFCLSGLLATPLILWREINFFLPHASSLFEGIVSFSEILPQSQRVVPSDLILQWWHWFFLVVSGFLSILFCRARARTYALMTCLPSYVYLIGLLFKEYVFPQDYIFPAFGLAFGTTLFFVDLLSQKRNRMIALLVFIPLMTFSTAFSIRAIHREILISFHPVQPNGFILYHHYARCSQDPLLRFSEFRACFQDLLENETPFGGTRNSRAQSDALREFIRNWTFRDEVSISSTMVNVFSRQSRSWYPAKAHYLIMEPEDLLLLAERADFFKSEEFRKLFLGGEIQFRGKEAVYDFHTGLQNETPKLIVMDFFIIDRLHDDEDAVEFIEKNYNIVYHLPSASFLGVHKILGRDVLEAWRVGRFVEGEADRLMFLAIEGRSKPAELARRALQFDPGHPEANFIVGRNLFETGRSGEATSYLVRAAAEADFHDLDAARLALLADNLEPEAREEIEGRMKDLLRDRGGSGWSMKDAGRQKNYSRKQKWEE